MIKTIFECVLKFQLFWKLCEKNIFVYKNFFQKEMVVKIRNV